MITMARKDNFSYLWDCRKMDSFLHCYEQPLYGNQRTGLAVSPSGGTLFLGGESGSISGRAVDSEQEEFSTFTSVPRCVSSLCAIDSGVVFAVGEREFPFQKKANSGHLGFIRTH
jgi:WD40 repeat protein